MSITFVVGFAVILFVLALIAEPIARLLRLPHSALLIVLGAVVAHLVTLGLGLDTGLRAGDFHDLIFFVFLPVLIFEAAFKLPQVELRADLGKILLLAIVGMVLTTLVAAVLLYWGIGHASGFPWIAALLAGALLAATDPVAVVAQLKSLGAPKRLAVLLEGESLFNDATAIVLFGIFLSLAAMPEPGLDAAGAVVDFVWTFSGGALVGAAFGFVGLAFLKLTKDPISRATVTLTAAYGSFLIAEGLLHVSGVMGSLSAGLILAREFRRPLDDHREIDYLWGSIAYLANGAVFLLMGLTITLSMFTERWLAMVIAIAAILIARTVATHGALGIANRLVSEPVPVKYQTAMVWGGLRGAVTLALALSLPVELDYWWTIQSMAFGVVLFTLLVQAPTTPLLLRRLGVVDGSLNR